MTTKLRVKDKVMVIAGKDRGKLGAIEKIVAQSDRVVVVGVNKIKRRLRKTERNPAGGTIERLAPIAISNVMIYCETCKKPRRIAIKIEGKTKYRVCKECQTSFDKKLS
ncbi:50S ribosomal protein L24 [Candidatus Berkelbacteria bacterium]|nr:50S ribosomal protein L24 [Candidatus Berkelbacteria bacterium]